MLKCPVNPEHKEFRREILCTDKAIELIDPDNERICFYDETPVETDRSKPAFCHSCGAEAVDTEDFGDA